LISENERREIKEYILLIYSFEIFLIAKHIKMIDEKILVEYGAIEMNLEKEHFSFMRRSVLPVISR